MTGNRKSIINWLLTQAEDILFDIKEHKKKRTTNQNDYYWELLNQLSRKMRIPSSELHFEMIKKSCPFEEIMIIDEASLRVFQYCEIIRKIKQGKKLFKIIRVYVGSSLLDTKEMGILLDNLIEECKLQNINTMTPDEVVKMKELG